MSKLRFKPATLATAALLVAIGLYVLYARSRPDEDSAADDLASEFKPVRHGRLPRSSGPEAERRYLERVTQDDRRAVVQLDEALAKARAEPHQDEEQIAKLEHERAERAARLNYHLAAQKKGDD